MKRRTLIKQMVYASAAVLLVPSCAQHSPKPPVALQNISVNEDEESLIAELAETIIPATDTPGARDISAHLFALKMVDDCFTKTEQQRFLSGLKGFEAESKKTYGNEYVKLPATDREKLLTKLEKGDAAKDDAAFFYTSVKGLTVRAYTTSKFFLTKVQVYELVPGRYRGSVPLKTA